MIQSRSQNQEKQQEIKQDEGFTLIEVMAVVAIIGILVTVVVSQYQDYIVRAVVLLRA